MAKIKVEFKYFVRKILTYQAANSSRGPLELLLFVKFFVSAHHWLTTGGAGQVGNQEVCMGLHDILGMIATTGSVDKFVQVRRKCEQFWLLRRTRLKGMHRGHPQCGLHMICGHYKIDLLDQL